MTNEEQAKWEEREAWERFALKALEFVPIQKNGEAYEPGQMTRRAASIATALVRERRDAFNELDIWPEQGDPQETFEPSKDAPVKEQERPPATFPDDLVERVKGIIVRVYSTPPGVRGTTWMSQAARDILSELASTPCELPTSEPIAHTLDSCDGAGQSTNFAKSMWLAQWLRDTLSPILAAKDAEFARLKYEAADMERLANARLTDVDMVEDKLRHEMECAAKRIAELESRTPANECSNAERTQYELTIELQKTKIAELEKAYLRINCPVCQRVLTLGEIKGGSCNAGHAGSSDIEYSIRRQLGWSGDTSEGRHLARIAELEKRIASLTAPVDANGKTPGQVLIDSQWGSEPIQVSKEMLESAEIDARAVLRAFGNGVEALKGVRERFEERFTYYQQITMRGEAFAIIDAEIAKCGAPVSSQSALDKLRERFAHTPESGDGDDGKWISRAYVLNAIDEIANIEGVKP